MEASVFKVLRRRELDAFLTHGRFDGSEDDRRDGFVHLSTRDQLDGTVAKHFAGERDLFILECRIRSDDVALRWETSRGGRRFPHLHRPLEASDVLAVRPLTAAEPRRATAPRSRN